MIVSCCRVNRNNFNENLLMRFCETTLTTQVLLVRIVRKKEFDCQISKRNDGFFVVSFFVQKVPSFL